MVTDQFDLGPSGKAGSLLTANDLMSYPVLKVSESWTLDEVILFFSKYRISRAPVINSVGSPIGVIAIKDILKGHLGMSEALETKYTLEHSYLAHLNEHDIEFKREIQDYLESTTALDCCQNDLVTVDIGCSLDEILAVMLQQDRHQIFVCDKERIVGVISSIDLMSYFTANSSVRAPFMQ